MTTLKYVFNMSKYCYIDSYKYELKSPHCVVANVLDSNIILS